MYVGRKQVIHTFRAGPGIKRQGLLHSAGLSYGGRKVTYGTQLKLQRWGRLFSSYLKGWKTNMAT